MESIFIYEDTTVIRKVKVQDFFLQQKKSINNELGEYFFAQEPEIRMPVVISDGFFSKDI
jgi:hypothetical protein